MFKVGGVSFLLILLLNFSACSTTKSSNGSTHSSRHGLFDRLRELDGPPVAVSVPSEIKKINIGFQWPLKHVKVTSPFGNRNGDFHEGVDLHAPVGTPVYAAQSGRVLYSGSKINGYGKLVVLKHASGFSTIYAHNSKLFVKKGEFVTKGRKIAYSGKTGRAHGPHLHFEVRKGIEAMNPQELAIVPIKFVDDKGGSRKLVYHNVPQVNGEKD